MRRIVLLRPASLHRGLFIAVLLAGSVGLQGCTSLENPLPAIGGFVIDTFDGAGTMFGNPVAGIGNFLGDTVNFTANPNRPIGESPNVQRVMGKGYEPEPLLPEPGDVWPGPLPDAKSLAELQREGTLGSAAPMPAQTPRTSAAPATIATPPAISVSRGRVLQTPIGPGVTTMGQNGIETIMLPNGQQGTVMKNPNGTANVLMPDGRSFSISYPQ